MGKTIYTRIQKSANWGIDEECFTFGRAIGLSEIIVPEIKYPEQNCEATLSTYQIFGNVSKEQECEISLKYAIKDNVYAGYDVREVTRGLDRIRGEKVTLCLYEDGIDKIWMPAPYDPSLLTVKVIRGYLSSKFDPLNRELELKIKGKPLIYQQKCSAYYAGEFEINADDLAPTEWRELNHLKIFCSQHISGDISSNISTKISFPAPWYNDTTMLFEQKNFKKDKFIYFTPDHNYINQIVSQLTRRPLFHESEDQRRVKVTRHEGSASDMAKVVSVIVLEKEVIYDSENIINRA